MCIQDYIITLISSTIKLSVSPVNSFEMFYSEQ